MLLAAIRFRSGSAPGSNFEYAPPLTEMVLLGNVALRAQGRKPQWDSANLGDPNAPEFERHLPLSYRTF